MQPDYWKKAQTHLGKACPTMKGIMKRYKGEGLQARGDGFYTLARSITGQQISVKAADAVWARVAKEVKPMTAKNVLKKTDAQLRACGLSESKVKYLRNVAEFYKDRGVTAEYWETHSDAEIIEALVGIKGIGTWTAEMFLIFHLMRPDVFSVKDLGVLKAIDLHYTGGKRLKPKEYVKFAERWAPYKTVATWYLWRSLDPVPVEY